jgi:hypothetical protein
MCGLVDLIIITHRLGKGFPDVRGVPGMYGKLVGVLEGSIGEEIAKNVK